MRAVLTGLSERGRRTNSPMRSRLAAISLGYKTPENLPENWYKKASPITWVLILAKFGTTLRSGQLTYGFAKRSNRNREFSPYPRPIVAPA